MKIVNADQNFQEKLSKFANVIIDLGTGDGRFAYKTAKENPDKLIIGIDPSHKQLEIYAKKINKERLDNILLVVASVEELPKELLHTADKLYINFPWGSLLGGIANAEASVIRDISGLLKQNGSLQITFGYSQEAEPSETKRLGVSNLDQEQIEDLIAPEFEKHNLYLVESVQLEKKGIFKIDSSWSKKLSFGAERKIFKTIFIKK